MTRCSGKCDHCRGAKHHWLAHRRQNDHPSVNRECKHCAIKGVVCADCDGHGSGKSIEEPVCEKCDGDGVLEWRLADADA